MTRGLRWRVLTLQVALIAIFGTLAGVLMWGANFSHSQVREQLAAQKITFPAATDKAITSLPAADAAAMRQYAGQQLVTGEQAKVYSDSFIAVHLDEMANGQTYAQLSAASLANPSDTKLAGQVAAMFKGTTLRGMLLDSYAWWTVGNIVSLAAIVMLVATGAVLLTCAFELERWKVASHEPARVTALAS